MWKVQKVADGDRVALRIIGRLERQQLPELQKVLGAEIGDHDFVLDLKEVKLVDQETVAFLEGCEAGGATLRNCPPYIREWVNSVRAGN